MRVWEDMRMFAFLVSSKRWQGSLLYVFVNSTAFIVCWMVAIADNTFDVIGFVFS